MSQKLKNKSFYKTFSLLSIVIALNISIVNAQTNITPDADYTIITPPTAGTFNIQAAVGNPPVNSTDGRTITINRYTNFTVGAGDTVNILLNGVNTSVNVVNGAGGTDISGILNSRLGGAGSPIGGNMVFVSPNGIFVGAAGQINAGSILLSTSGQSLMPLGPGFAANADLNDPLQDANIRIQGINTAGTTRFTNYNNDIFVSGNINSIDPSPIFQINSAPIMGNGYGVYLFGRSITTLPGSNITTNIPADIFMATGNDIRWNLSNYIISPFAALANRGEISLQGNITTPSGYVNITNDTNDIVNNTINISGIINANAIFPGDRGGFVNLRNVVAAGGNVVLDGAAGGGNILAMGNTDGGGGTLNIMPTPSFQIINGGSVDLRNGPTATGGGAFSIQSQAGVNTQIGGPFLDPATIAAITLADNAATGNILIFNSGVTPDIEIVNAINFPANTNVSITALNGNINMNSGVNPVIVNGDVTLRGDNININGLLRTTGSEIDLLTRTGLVNIGVLGLLDSSPGSDIKISRTGTLGTLTVLSSGTIRSGGGADDLLIGNTTANDFTRTSIDLIGPTFAAYGITYNANSDIVVDPLVAPQLVVNTMNIVIALPVPPPPPPPPPAPPAPVPINPVNPPAPPNPDVPNDNRPTNNVIITETESVSSDLEETETKLETSEETQQTINAVEKGLSEQNDISDYIDITAFNLTETITVCNVKEDSCEKFTEKSLGQDVVKILLDGYPYVNEFAADNNGVVFSYGAEYNPKGLEGFLMKIKYLEDEMAKQGIQDTSKNTLLGYKHPPAEQRLEKIDLIIKTEQMDSTNAKVNSNKYNKVVGKALE